MNGGAESLRSWAVVYDGRSVATLRADLTGANLQSANLKKAKLHDANLFGANLQHAKLGGFISRELHKSNLSLKTEESGSGIGANLSGADLQGADFTEANLEGADLTGANLLIANLTGANLRGAHLTDANLTHANLWGTDLKGADLQGADFTGAYLRGTDLTEANLRGADHLQDVKMNYSSIKALPRFNAPRFNANITQEQLDKANGDDRTMLPDRLTRPAHWPKAEAREGQPATQPDDGERPPSPAGAPGSDK